MSEYGNIDGLQERDFEALLSTLDMTTMPLIHYELHYPKEDFLRFIVHHMEALLHGSGKDVDVLLPRQANDDAKTFGNRLAVYAVDDPVLAIFYAIQDRGCIHGPVISGRTVDEFLGDYSYNFAMLEEVAARDPWSNGFVYIVSRDGFEQGRQDSGKLADEWCSCTPVRPIAKLSVAPTDFRFLGHIQTLDGRS